MSKPACFLQRFVLTGAAIAIFGFMLIGAVMVTLYGWSIRALEARADWAETRVMELKEWAKWLKQQKLKLHRLSEDSSGIATSTIAEPAQSKPI